jgi:trehalose 6-phosphate phosphatase
MNPPLLAPNTALFLDIDGTLVEFAPRPEDVRIPPAVLETITTLRRRLGGALAVVSGRALTDIDRLFAPLQLAASGQHGSEARLAPGSEDQVFAAHQVALGAVMAEVQPHLATHPEIRVEHKGLSIAFHYRGAEVEGPALRTVLAAAVARHDMLQLLDSHLCYDVRPHEANKGKAVTRFMGGDPFAGRMPVYIGDDRTDEDGFAVSLALGGRAILVGPPRPTLATERIDTPAALRAWLDQAIQTLR